MTNLTTMERIKVYAASGVSEIILDMESAVFLCDLATETYNNFKRLEKEEARFRRMANICIALSGANLLAVEAVLLFL